MKSKEQVALEEDRIAALTSTGVAGEKDDRMGGTDGGREWGESVELVVNFEQSFVILSPKECKNDEARSALEQQVGRHEGDLRESNASSADHSFLGLLQQSEIRLR